MVNTKRIIKYITKMGQKTGILNASINVHTKAIIMARVLPYLDKINKVQLRYSVRCYVILHNTY